MTDIPRYDFHMHTKYLGCANGTMEIPAMIRECEQLGVTALGITDHLGALDRLDRHALIKQDIGQLDTEIEVYFGVELNYVADGGDFACTTETKEQFGFQFAIGAIHDAFLDTYDLKKIVDIQHRHHLKSCRDPVIDVLAHPFRFAKGEFDRKGWPWFDSMQAVPVNYARELGQTAKETGTAIEINAAGILLNPAFNERYIREYMAFLEVVADEGAMFSPASDAHDIGQLKFIRTAWQVAEQLHLTPERIWRPRVPGIVQGRHGR